MSTFKGVVSEFPDITIDYFRPRPGMPLPLACFLSHIHTDHLDGLVSFKSPFIYCSPATKELLVRLEPKKQRVWYENRITESRKPIYKHLKDVLRAIPLETPTKIELKPGHEIQVTLFDANHCVGAVMFLIEGQGKAVLYTGDIRAEPWWINKITRHPAMIEYSSGLKTLDCIYLDTSNTKRTGFPTKAEGLKELLQKVAMYRKDTVFHISSWTFGYEEVWMALSKALDSPIHVDAYKYRLYKSLCGNSPHSDSAQSSKAIVQPISAEGPALIGYKCGNTFAPGCLTLDKTVRLHSCEKGTCPQIDNNDSVVWIRPIVTRTTDGEEVAEVGIGGGGEDLSRDLELDIDDSVDIEGLLKILDTFADPQAAEVKRIIAAGWDADNRRLTLNGYGLNLEEGSMTPSDLINAVRDSVIKAKQLASAESHRKLLESQGPSLELPSIITFPYSRHAAYDELCDLVKAFRPRDVYPCTVDEKRWDEEDISIADLFGDFCSGSIYSSFRHEKEMNAWRAIRKEQPSTQQTHTTTTSPQSSQRFTSSSPVRTRISNEARLEIVQSYGLHASPIPVNHENREGTPRQSRDRATPPRLIVAISPNSASQNLRRKAIHERLQDAEVKRICRSYDSSPSSPINSSPINDGSQPAEKVDHEVEAVASFEDTTLVASEVIDLISSQILPAGGEPAIVTSSESEDDEWADREIDYAYARYDEVDNMYRCFDCGHELWGGPHGHCTGPCRPEFDVDPEFGGDDDDTRYVEVLHPECPPLPQIANGGSYKLLDGESFRDAVGECLDYDSSAYDSVDSGQNLNEEYDARDPFIDDSEPSNEDDGSEEDNLSHEDEPVEPDYKAMYLRLQATHTELIDDYVGIDSAFRNFRRDVGIDTSDSDGMDGDELDDEEMDEDGMLIVDVKNPDPVTTEIIISHALEQSQESQLTDERIRTRARAFEAAQTPSGWFELDEMMSTTGNHTIAEIEL